MLDCHTCQICYPLEIKLLSLSLVVVVVVVLSSKIKPRFGRPVHFNHCTMSAPRYR